MNVREPNLTDDGVLKLIAKTREVVTVQVLDIRPTPNTYQHSIMVSDGFKRVSGFLYSVHAVKYYAFGNLDENSVIDIKDYVIETYNDRPFVLINDLDIKDKSPGGIIGNPVLYTGRLIPEGSEND